MKESRAHFARFMRRRWLSLPRWFWSVMLAQGIVRFALMLPHGLLHDEAYYWFWGQELQLSYYENAPGTGWFLAPFLWLFGDEAWVMRLAAGLFGLFATYCAARLVCDLLPAHGSHLRSAADEKAEDEALQRFSVFVLATIIFWGLFSFWTHDVGCTAFAFFGIWMTVRALKDGRTRWWLLAGAGLGLSLLGKYTAALWIAASALFVLWDVEARRSLRRFAPWSALLVVLLALLPDLVWNHRNGWASFHFVSYRHLNTSDLSLQERMLNLLEYAATIVVAVGIPFCFVLVRSVRASKSWWNGLPVQQRYVFFRQRMRAGLLRYHRVEERRLHQLGCLPRHAVCYRMCRFGQRGMERISQASRSSRHAAEQPCRRAVRSLDALGCVDAERHLRSNLRMGRGL